MLRMSASVNQQIIDRFHLLSYDSSIQPHHFTEEKLDKIASDVSSPVNSVIQVLVEYFLMNFSLKYGKAICDQSNRLYNSYVEFHTLLEKVLSKIDDDSSIEKMEEVQAYFERMTAYAPISKTRYVAKLKLLAVRTHDILASFPQQFALLSSLYQPTTKNIHFLPVIFKALANKEKLDSTMTRVFFKFVALYSERGNFLTWYDVGVEWGKSSEENGRSFTLFLNLLPCHRIVRSLFNSSESSNKSSESSKSPTFKNFLIAKTIDYFEKGFATEIAPFFRQDLESKMDSENFRLEISFYTGNPERLLDRNFKCSERSRPWLTAARRLLCINHENVFGELQKFRLFRWALRTKENTKQIEKLDSFSTLDPNEKKKNINGYLEEIEKLSSLLKSFDTLDPDALSILLIMREHELPLVEAVTKQICANRDEFIISPLETFEKALLK